MCVCVRESEREREGERERERERQEKRERERERECVCVCVLVCACVRVCDRCVVRYTGCLLPDAGLLQVHAMAQSRLGGACACVNAKKCACIYAHTCMHIYNMLAPHHTFLFEMWKFCGQFQRLGRG